MDLGELANTRAQPRRGPQCSVRRALDTMPDDLADLLTRALDNPFATAVQISRALREHDYQIGEQSIARHRRAVCRCATA